MAVMERVISILGGVVLVLGGCSESSKLRCDEPPLVLAWDQPGPWDFSAADVFGAIEPTQTGTVLWLDLLQSGELDQSEAETEATLEITVAGDSATAGDLDPDRGACRMRMTTDATLTIFTADGLLDESIPIEIEVDRNGRTVNGLADLTDHGFVGALDLGPKWGGSILTLTVTYTDGSLDVGAILGRRRVDPDLGEIVGDNGVFALIRPD